MGRRSLVKKSRVRKLDEEKLERLCTGDRLFARNQLVLLKKRMDKYAQMGLNDNDRRVLQTGTLIDKHLIDLLIANYILRKWGLNYTHHVLMHWADGKELNQIEAPVALNDSDEIARQLGIDNKKGCFLPKEKR